MIQVDFYLLPNSDYLNFVCRLVDKAYQMNQSAYIYVANENAAKKIDDLLWTFSDTSFIPHGIVNEMAAEEILYLIGFDQPPKFCQNILMNLTDDIPHFFNQFARIIEIIPADETKKMLARKRYAKYREQGCEMKMHELK